MGSWDSKQWRTTFHIGNALGSLTPQHRWDHVLWLLDLQKTNDSCGYCETPCDGGNGQVPTCGEVDCHRILQGSNDSTMASTNVPLYIRGWIYTILIYIYTLYICIIYYRVSRFYLCVSPASGMDGFPMQSHNFCLMKRVRRSFFCLQHLEHLSIHTFVGRICYEILWMRTFRTFRTSLIELDWILHNLLCRALNFRTQEVTPGTSADTANGQAAVATGNPRESQRLLMGINGNHIYWLMPT